MTLKSQQVVMTALNATLYAVFGYMTFLGIFAPIVGVVRFWGIAVVVPAVFAALFGGMVGGVGAAIGIFISDMIILGNPLLSLAVGVPANFVMFYIIGEFGRIRPKISAVNMGVIVSCLIILTIFISNFFLSSVFTFEAIAILIGFTLISVILVIVLVKFWARWRWFTISSIIGNALGSAIVGVGVWLFSQFFILPANLGHKLPFTAALIWFTWTFTNQMPFLLIFGPPILQACSRAFPSLIEPRSLDS
jgi:hypothetical protein